MSNETDDRLRMAQAEVEGLLGRCLLRLQSYERLMKAIVAEHHLSGSAETFSQMRATRAAQTDRHTLGMLVGQIMGSFIVAGEPTPLPGSSCDDTSVAVRMQIGLRPDDFVKVEADLQEFVALRNRLVHHFLEDHELRSLEGCAHARCALVDASERIERGMGELRKWATSLETMHSMLHGVLNTEEFRDILTGKTIPWPVTMIVHALREAETALMIDGWAPVRKAADWISKHYPDERPDGYRCRSWQQVVHESRLFDLRYRVRADGRREACYRSRTEDGYTR